LPGPANYYPQLPRARPAFSIGSGLRFKRESDSQTANSPGPSDYDISRSVVAMHTAPSIVIASKSYINNQYSSISPGPAEYSPDGIYMYNKRNKGFSLLGRHSEYIGVGKMPGPGAYNVVRDPTRDRQTPAYSIGARPKTEDSGLRKYYLPGPGSYNPRSIQG